MDGNGSSHIKGPACARACSCSFGRPLCNIVMIFMSDVGKIHCSNAASLECCEDKVLVDGVQGHLQSTKDSCEVRSKYLQAAYLLRSAAVR